MILNMVHQFPLLTYREYLVFGSKFVNFKLFLQLMDMFTSCQKVPTCSFQVLNMVFESFHTLHSILVLLERLF